MDHASTAVREESGHEVICHDHLLVSFVKIKAAAHRERPHGPRHYRGAYPKNIVSSHDHVVVSFVTAVHRARPRRLACTAVHRP